MSAHLLLAILLSLPSAYGDNETASQREERMGIVADAIVDAAEQATCTGDYATDDCVRVWPESTESLELLLVAQGYRESLFAKNVHEGRCLAHQCDGGRARSLWQIHAGGSVPYSDWVMMGRADEAATKLAAKHAANILSIGRNRCRSVEGAISLYATGRTCKWSGAKSRADLHSTLLQNFEE